MTNQTSEYLTAIHEKVCGVCAERTMHGTCGLSVGAVCPIEKYLPKIVDTVHSAHSNKMADYVQALRRNVCGSCPNSGLDGNCPFRSQANCVLDRYFALVVDAIDAVDEYDSWPRCVRWR